MTRHRKLKERWEREQSTEALRTYWSSVERQHPAHRLPEILQDTMESYSPPERMGEVLRGEHYFSTFKYFPRTARAMIGSVCDDELPESRVEELPLLAQAANYASWFHASARLNLANTVGFTIDHILPNADEVLKAGVDTLLTLADPEYHRFFGLSGITTWPSVAGRKIYTLQREGVEIFLQMPRG